MNLETTIRLGKIASEIKRLEGLLYLLKNKSSKGTLSIIEKSIVGNHHLSMTVTQDVRLEILDLLQMGIEKEIKEFKAEMSQLIQQIA